MTDKERNEHYRRINRIRIRLERKAVRVIFRGVRLTSQPLRDLVERGYFDAVRFAELDSTHMMTAMKEAYLILGLPFARNATDQIQKASTFDVEYWAEFLMRFVQETLGTQIVLWPENLREEYLSAIADAVSEQASRQLSVSEMSNMILDKAEGFEEWMSRRVARTESMRASNYAQQEAIKRTGEGTKTLKFWLAGNDNRTRPDHLAMNGTPGIPLEATYDVGGEPAMYPGDPMLSAANSINCRCCEVYEVVDDEQATA